MGTGAHVIVVGGRPGLAGVARRRVEDLEGRWSRFLPDSEVSELNRRAGDRVQVSAETAELVARAVEGWRLSAGAFDPTLLGAILRAGYDRPFDRLERPSPAAVRSDLDAGAAGIEVDGDTVRLPAGTGFDPGGIGKGLAADLVTREIMAAGAEGVCVNLGGDVRVRGAGPEGEAWTVAVDHPWSAAALVHLGLVDGAVATSTTLRRRWEVEGDVRHHLIDPQTGLPSTTEVTLATVVAGEAWAAEVLVKAVLLAGAAHPFDILGGTGAEALVVDEGGRIRASAGLAAYTGGHGIPSQLNGCVC